MGKIHNLEGQKFGKLTAIAPKIKYTKGGNRLRHWVCLCECGNYTEVSTHDLLIGHTKGCNKCAWYNSSKVKHKRIYDTWRMMIARCENPKAQAFYNYGGRGIKVCKEWHDFDTFLNWALANGYDETLTIDRRDVNGNYTPNNCRWVSDKVQSNNRRTNHFVTYKGETHTVCEWAEIVKMPYSTLISRLNNGWNIEDAFERPLRKDPRRKVV